MYKPKSVFFVSIAMHVVSKTEILSTKTPDELISLTKVKKALMQDIISIFSQDDPFCDEVSIDLQANSCDKSEIFFFKCVILRSLNVL